MYKQVKDVCAVIGPGVLSVLLDEHTASCPSEQLRVLFCGDALVQPEAGPAVSGSPAAQVPTVTNTNRPSFMLLCIC